MNPHPGRFATAKAGKCPDCDAKLWRVPVRLLPPYKNNKSIYEGHEKGFEGYACPDCAFTCAFGLEDDPTG